jgi:hypothetical protein
MKKDWVSSLIFSFMFLLLICGGAETSLAQGTLMATQSASAYTPGKNLEVKLSIEYTDINITMFKQDDSYLCLYGEIYYPKNWSFVDNKGTLWHKIENNVLMVTFDPNFCFMLNGYDRLPEDTYTFNVPEGETGLKELSGFIRIGNVEVQLNTLRLYPLPDSVFPKSAVNKGTTTVTLRGSGFSKDSRVTLTHDVFSDITAKNVTLASSELMYAAFDLTDAEPGIYDIRVEKEGSEPLIFEKIFEIKHDGISGHIRVAVKPPQFVRPARQYTCWIE